MLDFKLKKSARIQKLVDGLKCSEVNKVSDLTITAEGETGDLKGAISHYHGVEAGLILGRKLERRPYVLFRDKPGIYVAEQPCFGEVVPDRFYFVGTLKEIIEKLKAAGR